MKSRSTGSPGVSWSPSRCRPVGRTASGLKAFGRTAYGRAGSQGFTLIESLTALSVLAIALVALMQSYSRSLGAARASDSYAAASVLAQSLLAELEGAAELSASTKRGRTGEFSWRMNVKPTGDRLRLKNARRAELFQISVRVAWPKSRSLVLETERLTEAQ